MTTTFVDRSAVEEKLAQLLTAKLVGTGKPAQAVYDYDPDDIGKQSPVVIVESLPSNRRNPFKSQRAQSLIFVNVHVLIVYANPDDHWTARDSRKALNLIEKGVCEVVADNNETDTWMNLDFNGSGTYNDIPMSGQQYRYEVIPLAAEVRA